MDEAVADGLMSERIELQLSRHAPSPGLYGVAVAKHLKHVMWPSSNNGTNFLRSRYEYGSQRMCT